MVKDKNGTEIKIGDAVHYYRPESTHEYDYGDGRTRTGTRPARDVVFTVDEFVDSPFVKHIRYVHHYRIPENRIWITGPELDSTRYGSRDAVSPLAVVKVDTFVKKAMPTFSLV